jgi:hypothetical protein
MKECRACVRTHNSCDHSLTDAFVGVQSHATQVASFTYFSVARELIKKHVIAAMMLQLEYSCYGNRKIVEY